MTTAFRLLVTEPLDGALNMAFDEALLLGRLAGTSPPTLRFFAWTPPTISLGYGQPLDHRIDVEAAASLGVGLVRRPTGGSAILHEGPGLELCFAGATGYEIELDGEKLVGSAQRRQGAGFLQHGAVMLGAAPDRLRRVFPGERDPLAGMTTLERALGRRPSFEETMTALAEGFRGVHGLELHAGGLGPDEVDRAEALVRDKYATERWTRSGRAPVVATAIG